MCVLNYHAAHIYLCGDVRGTVYGQNFGIYADRYMFHYPGLQKRYEQYSEFMWTEIRSIIQEKYLKFMWIEIRSIIWKISIPMFSLCDKNITWAI